MFIWSEFYVKDHMPAGRAERAMSLTDVEMFKDWLRDNWEGVSHYLPKGDRQ
jgi:hypothetical protein